MGLFDVSPVESPAGGVLDQYYDTAIPQSYLDSSNPGFDWSIPTAKELMPDTIGFFPAPTSKPDGAASGIDGRSNTSFWSFDQSTITGGLGDVLGSVVQAGAKSAVQYGASSINSGANQNGVWGSFARNFRSTKTGAEMNAASYATQLQNILFNPIVWFVAVAGIVLFFFMRK